MPEAPPVLHLLCGKIAAGKSTLAASLSAPSGTLLLSEDKWLSTLYPENGTVEDYRRTSALLREVMGEHVATLLGAGLSVVLDWPANTRRNRQWMKEIVDASDAAHQLHYLDVPDEVCLARLQARNASGRHEYEVSEEQFHEITSYFEPPSEAEGFNIVFHHRS